MYSPRRARRPQYSTGFRIRRVVGWMLISLALVMGGVWTWETFGTTWMIRGQMIEAIDNFSAELPPAPVNIAPRDVICWRPDEGDFTGDCTPPDLDRSGLEVGDPFGIMTVPTWEGTEDNWGNMMPNRILVREGSNIESLNYYVLDGGAASHYPDTVGPGQVGNFALAGHRRSFGDSFLHLPDLELGQFVIIETAEAWYIYEIIGHQIVLPTETWVVNPDPFTPPDENGMQHPTRRLATWTTCTLANGSQWGNSHRWITWGELYAWMPRDAGVPPMIDAYWTVSGSDQA